MNDTHKIGDRSKLKITVKATDGHYAIGEKSTCV
jgi:hypothetical protein